MYAVFYIICIYIIGKVHSGGPNGKNGINVSLNKQFSVG